ncbi:G-type lectin S-receptor-like serine/threonine-protein kinase SD2-5 [Physcomitrium patens]|uniref:Receptor-like serine/threonine-protein kinase n=1 Tax=Physcomitrium patens TaxID=3218 RepID=A0A7I4C513_PHYPA
MGCKVPFLLLLGLSALVFRVASQKPPSEGTPSTPPSAPGNLDFRPSSSAQNSSGFNYWSATESLTVLVSSNEKFSLNLEKSNYSVSSCVAKVLHIPSNVPIWIANFASNSSLPRDDEVDLNENCRLNFSKDGLELSNQSDIVWSVRPKPEDTATLGLTDFGNLEIRNSLSNVLWCSFDFPSDILVAYQTVNVTGYPLALTAADPIRNYSIGSFFSMLVERQNVTLTQHFKINCLNEPRIYNFSYYDVTNDTEIRSIGLSLNKGLFINDNKTISDQPSPQSSSWQYARLHQTGALVISSYDENGTEIGNRTINPNRACLLPGQCGPYGLCHSGNNSCSCPPGFVASSSPYFTCKRKVDIDSTCKNDTFISVTGMTYLGIGLFGCPNSTLAQCKLNCSNDCKCTNALHVKSSLSDSGTCYLMPGEAVQTIRKTGNDTIDLQTLFLRIVNGSDAQVVSPESGKKSTRKTADAFAGGAGAFIFLLLVGSMWWLFYNRRKLFSDADNNAGKNLLVGDVPYSKSLQRFSYQEMVESTGNFTQKLGSAGFSSVYRGHLPDNTKVAVKKLEDIDFKEKEFLAAVAAIGRISQHPNLVPLRGYCKDGQHQMLVYELVTEGQSLNKYLFNVTNSVHMLTVQDRHLIALGAARGVAHLHQEYNSCKTIHGALTPENIIVDRHKSPRLVDYGLVGLMGRDQRLRAANMRNSQGYMAPEWVKLMPITEKVDVYSLGIVILELVSGRRCIKQGASAEQCFLPTWGFSLISRKYGDDGQEAVLELVDPSIGVRDLSSTYKGMLRNMIFVALRCVQEDVNARPSMQEVVKMLEGPSPVETPPPSPGLEAFGRELYAGCAGARGPESSNSSSFMHSTSLTRSSDKRPSPIRNPRMAPSPPPANSSVAKDGSTFETSD